MQRTGHGDQGVFLARALLRLLQTVAIFFLVAEFQGIFGFDAVADFDGRIGIEERLESVTRADTHVVAALGTDVQVALEFGAIQHRVAGSALHP